MNSSSNKLATKRVENTKIDYLKCSFLVRYLCLAIAISWYVVPAFSQPVVHDSSPPAALRFTDSNMSGMLDVKADSSGPLNYVIVSQSSHGTVSIDPEDPSMSYRWWKYTPTGRDFAIADSFTFKAIDSAGRSSNIGTVTLTFTPNPYAVDGYYTVEAGQVLNGELIAMFSNSTAISITIVDQPKNKNGTGVGSVTTAGPAVSSTLGAITTTKIPFSFVNPSSTDDDQVTFSFKASAGTIDSQTGTITVVLRRPNKLPVAKDIPLTTDEDKEASGKLSAKDDDNDPIGYRILSYPAHGTVILKSNTGDFIYHPSCDKSNDDSFTYVAYDSFGASPPATVSITLNHVNERPTANSFQFDVDENGTFKGNLSASDPDGNPDRNGHKLKFTLITKARHGDANIDSTGSFTYTPYENYSGWDSFGFSVNDTRLDSAEATVRVTIKPKCNGPRADALTFVLPSVPLNGTGKISGELRGLDWDNSTLEYKVDINPTHGSLAYDKKSGRFDYTYGSNQSDYFTYTVSNGIYASLAAEVHLSAGGDTKGFIGDTLNNKVTSISFPFAATQAKLGLFTDNAIDQVVDRANHRLYVLADNGLYIYDIDISVSPAQISKKDSVDISGTRLALSLDGRTAYIAGGGKITAVNLYPEGVFTVKKPGWFTSGYAQSKNVDEFDYKREFALPKGIQNRAVVAMGVNPAGNRLLVVVAAISSKVNITNDLLRSDVSNGIRSERLTDADLPSDFGYITQLDISADTQTEGGERKQPTFAPAIGIKDLLYSTAKKEVALGIRSLTFSPDGNCAFLTAVGAQTPRATAYGIMPTTDEGTGGIVVLDVRPPALPTDPWVRYLSFIPTTEKDEKTAELRSQIRSLGWKTVHPDLQVARTQVISLEGHIAMPKVGSEYAAAYCAAVDDLLILEDAYKDYGYMQAYLTLYPRDMVGASSLAINHAGDFGIVTLQDTNNLGLLSLSPSDKLKGYSPETPPNFYIKTGTGKAVNGTGSTFSWMYPQKVAFTSDDSRIYIGMAGGTPKADLTNLFGTSDAQVLLKQRDAADSVFKTANPKPGYFLYGGVDLKSPRLASTLNAFDSAGDQLSDALKTYNRWNALRIIPNDPQDTKKKRLIDTDPNDPQDRLIPGKPAPYNTGVPDALNKGYLLPTSGLGYRLNTFGLPVDTNNFASRGVASAIEQLGCEWDQRYCAYLQKGKDADIPITRSYFVVGLLSQLGGGIVQNSKNEPIKYKPSTGEEVDLPYFSENSDAAFDFVSTNDAAHPTDNSGERIKGFDTDNTAALLKLLLARSSVKTIELDPRLLDLFPWLKKDPRVIPHGVYDPKVKNNSRRDLDDHMFVTFNRLSVELSIDSDNNGVLDQTPEETALKNNTGSGGKLILPATGDRDGDGVPDYADGFSGGQNVADSCAKFAPMVIRFPDDLDLAKVEFRLNYSASNPNAMGTTPPYSLPANGTYRIWTKDGDLARNKAEIGGTSGGDYISPQKWFSTSALNLGSARKCTVYIESVRPMVSADESKITIELRSTDPLIAITSPLQDTVLASSASGDFAVDTNCDNQIKLASEDPNDVNSASTPFFLWVNDDHDQALSMADLEKPIDAVDGVVNGQGDLKDFFPVFLDIKALVMAIPPSGVIKYKLKQADGALNFVYTNLTRATAFDFQSIVPPLTGFGPTLGQAAMSATTQQITSDGIDIFAGSPAFLNAIQNQNGGVILIEGRKTTTQPLFLVVERNGEKIAEYPLYLRWVEIVEDSNKNGIVEPNDKGVKQTRFGLWDQAYTSRQDGDVFQDKDFVANDARCFYVRITDPSANKDSTVKDSFEVEWYTSKSDGTDDDRPSAHSLNGNLTVTESSPNSSVFVSRALMAVTDDIDAAQPTFDGLKNTIGPGLLDHALRRANLDGFVNIRLSVSKSASAKMTARVFPPCELRRLKARVVVYCDPTGKPFTDDTYVLGQQNAAKPRWAQVGLQIDFEDPIVHRTIPAGALDANGYFSSGTATSDRAEEAIVFNDLVNNLGIPDKTLAVVYVPQKNGASGYTYFTPYAQTAMGWRVFIFMGNTTPVEGNTLTHELFHALYHAPDIGAWKPFFTFSTRGMTLWNDLPPLPNVAWRRRLHVETIMPVDWLRKHPTTFSSYTYVIGVPNDTTGNWLIEDY